MAIPVHVTNIGWTAPKASVLFDYVQDIHQFETQVVDLLQIDTANKAVIAVSSGTVGLHTLVTALRLARDQALRFATQAFGAPATVQGPLAGASIIDIDQGGGLDLTQVDSDSIDGLIVTNCFGHLVDINKYVQWCHDHGKLLLFDNAATPMTSHEGRNATNYGAGCVISFHHSKPLGYGERV